MSLLARFIAANQRLCKATENYLPLVFKHHIQTLYKYQVAALLNRRPGQVVLDIGGGKECPFLPYINAPRTHLIIALDISERRCAITVGSITRSSPTRRPEDYRFETAWWISSYPAPNGALVTPAGTFSWAGQDQWGWDMLLDGQPVGPPANQIYLDGNGEVWVLANTIWFKYPDFQNPAAPNPPPPACPLPPPPPPPAPPAGPTLAVNGSTTPAPIVAGDQFWVAIRNDPGNSLDFVGFCDASQPDNGTYYSKTNVGGVANADLVISATDLTPGSCSGRQL